MSADDERALAESILVAGLSSEEEVADLCGRIGNRRTAAVVAAVFTEVMNRKYSSQPSLEEMIEYSRYLAGRFTSEQVTIKPLVVEGLMRTHYGEAGLVGSLRIDDIVMHQMLISCELFSTFGLDANDPDSSVYNVDEAVEAALKLLPDPF